jgi:hypothetical protein
MNICGEEPPHIAKKCFEKIIGGIVTSITSTPSKPCEFVLNIKETGEKITYSLANPGANRTRGDIFWVNRGVKQLIEFTACCLSSSGNNAQFQRFTKFIPFIFSSGMRLSYYIYNPDDLKDTLSNQYLTAFRMWKTLGINVYFEKMNMHRQFQEIPAFLTPLEVVSTWNKTSNKCKIIVVEDKYTLDHFHVVKKTNNRVTADPEIGKCLLVAATLAKIGVKNINITNSGICEPAHFAKNNKFFKSIKHISNSTDCTISFDYELINTKMETVQPYLCSGECFSGDCTSESVVSINYELELEQKGKVINYTNHASCEQSRCEFGTLCTNIPKSVKKADIIYTQEAETLLVEAELYSNLEKGVEQIKEWSTIEKTKKYYTEEVFIGQTLSAYIILYDLKNEHKPSDWDLPRFSHVKKILSVDGTWHENPKFTTFNL